MIKSTKQDKKEGQRIFPKLMEDVDTGIVWFMITPTSGVVVYCPDDCQSTVGNYNSRMNGFLPNRLSDYDGKIILTSNL